MFGEVHNEFLGMFTKLQKVTISYATAYALGSVCNIWHQEYIDQYIRFLFLGL